MNGQYNNTHTRSNNPGKGQVPELIQNSIRNLMIQLDELKMAIDSTRWVKIVTFGPFLNLMFRFFSEIDIAEILMKAETLIFCWLFLNMIGKISS